jgi:hypothetical protein
VSCKPRNRKRNFDQKLGFAEYGSDVPENPLLRESMKGIG